MRATMVAALLLLAWAPEAAHADDEDKRRVAELEAQVARMTAEAAQRRTAYDQLAANTARATQAVAAMTSSMQASQALGTALRAQNAALKKDLAALQEAIAARPADDPARLKPALLREQAAHTSDVASMQARISEVTKRANLYAVRTTNAENQLAQERERQTRDVTRLQERINRMTEELRELKPPARGGESLAARHKEDLAAVHGHYADLLVAIGTPAVKPLLRLLAEDAVAAAPRVCPILGRMGTRPAAAVPALEAIAADEAHQRRGVARYAQAALQAIREAP